MAWVTVETDTDRICPDIVVEGGQVVVRPFYSCLLGPGEVVTCKVISGETPLETITIEFLDLIEFEKDTLGGLGSAIYCDNGPVPIIIIEIDQEAFYIQLLDPRSEYEFGVENTIYRWEQADYDGAGFEGKVAGLL